jgi:hypothetical protein
MPYTSDCLLGETLDSLIMCICLVCQTMETSFLQQKTIVLFAYTMELNVYNVD